jgi:hypothetical protein
MTRMGSKELHSSGVLVDPVTIAFYLHVPRSHVILLQAYFELYDGVGTVRTPEDQDRVVCVLTPRDLKDDCIGILEAIRGEVHWEVASPPETPAVASKEK